MSDLNKIDWEKVWKLNDGRITEQYMEKNFKEVKKFTITNMNGFILFTILLIIGIGNFAVSGLNIAGVLHVSPCSIPLNFIIGGICSILGVTGMLDCIIRETVKVPLTDADKLLGD